MCEYLSDLISEGKSVQKDSLFLGKMPFLKSFLNSSTLSLDIFIGK